MTAKPARADLRILNVLIQDLTAEAFGPYGEISQPAVALALDFDGRPASICEVRFEHEPFRINFLARHLRTTQTYVPLGSSESILVVAPPSESEERDALPDLTRIAAFRLTGDHAVNLRRGTWHRHPFPVAGTASFVVLDAEGTLDDIDLVNLELNLGASISIGLP
jgi:ureidoglycolate hydrolase